MRGGWNSSSVIPSWMRRYAARAPRFGPPSTSTGPSATSGRAPSSTARRHAGDRVVDPQAEMHVAGVRVRFRVRRLLVHGGTPAARGSVRPAGRERLRRSSRRGSRRDGRGRAGRARSASVRRRRGSAPRRRAPRRGRRRSSRRGARPRVRPARMGVHGRLARRSRSNPFRKGLPHASTGSSIGSRLESNPASGVELFSPEVNRMRSPTGSDRGALRRARAARRWSRRTTRRPRSRPSTARRRARRSRSATSTCPTSSRSSCSCARASSAPRRRTASSSSSATRTSTPRRRSTAPPS